MKPRHRVPPALIILAALIALSISWLLPTSNAQGQVQVTAADPFAAEQGTINLNVKVTGKGFKIGAKAKWFVTGTADTGGVTVNSTTYVSSTELTANITVADTATIANFDIQVLNSDGRGGKGTELFAVTAKGQAVCPALQPAPTTDSKCYDFSSGCFDTTFGGNGFVTTDLPTSGETATAVVLQPDGKIILTAQVQSASTGADFAVLRYNVDGSRDNTFGDPDPANPLLRLGYAVTAITSVGDWAEAVLLQSDGKIVVTGSANGSRDMAAVRYNVDGTLDSTFGSGGIVRVNFGNTKYIGDARDVGQQSDGKLILFGGGNGQFALARLNTNGSLDSSFASGGKLVVNASGSRNGSSRGFSLALQRVPAVAGEERMVVGGWSRTSSSDNQDWTLMRIRPDGSTDTTFGTGGILKTTFTGLNDSVETIKIDSSNRIVALGSINAGSPCGGYVSDDALVRYTQEGNVDGSFSGGKQIVDIYGGSENFYDLAFQTDGKILIFGDAYNAYISGVDRKALHVVLVRFNVDGSRDASFGLQGNGVVAIDVTANGGAGAAVVVQPNDGRIVGVGSYASYMFVARFLP